MKGIIRDLEGIPGGRSTPEHVGPEQGHVEAPVGSGTER